MRRSARISAKKGLSISKTENVAPEGTKTDELPATDHVIQKKPRGRPKKTLTPVVRTVRISTRQNSNPIEIRVNKDDSAGFHTASVNHATETGNGKEDDTDADKYKGAFLDEVKGDAASFIEKEARLEDEGQRLTLPTKKIKHKLLKETTAVKDNVTKEKKLTSRLPKQQRDLTVLDADIETKETHDSNSFTIISKEKFETGSMVQDDVVIKSDPYDADNNKDGSKELYQSVENLDSTYHNVESTVSDMRKESVKIDDSFQNIHNTLSTHKQMNTRKDAPEHKKYPLIHNIGKLKISHSFAKTSSKRDLLSLTSEVFQKIPFKITKDALVTNKLQERMEVNLKQKHNDDSGHGTDSGVLQQDVIYLTEDDSKSGDLKNKVLTLSSELDPRVKSNDLYFKIEEKRTAPTLGDFGMKRKEEKKILKRSAIGPDFEQKGRSVNAKKMKKHKLKETAGAGWFNLPKPEMTDEVKRDVQLIKMRNILDPKRFYKKGDKKISKYFQVGTVVSGAAEFYSSRLPKKERKRNMVDELLADAEFRRRNKKKYLEIQEQKANRGKKFHKRMKHRKKEKSGRS